MRMIRELRCEPAIQWFESHFGSLEPVRPAAPAPQDPVIADLQPAPEEGADIESWLM